MAVHSRLGSLAWQRTRPFQSWRRSLRGGGWGVFVRRRGNLLRRRRPSLFRALVRSRRLYTCVGNGAGAVGGVGGLPPLWQPGRSGGGVRILPPPCPPCVLARTGMARPAWWTRLGKGGGWYDSNSHRCP